MKTYTEMVARTTTREAMINGTADRLLEHGQDPARITGGVSKVTRDKCIPWVGCIVSLTGKTPGYPTLDDARSTGLFHPDCTHNIATAMTLESEIAKSKYSAEPEKKIKAAISYADDIWRGLSEAERNAIYLYTDRDIKYLINNHIYNVLLVEPEIIDIIKDLDSALAKAELPEDMILYRGMLPDTWEKLKNNKNLVTPGKEGVLDGFTSSSHDRSVAYNYASKKTTDGSEFAIIELLAPKSTQAMAIQNFSQSKSDLEVLVNKDTKVKVIEAIKDGNITRLIWEVIP